MINEEGGISDVIKEDVDRIYQLFLDNSFSTSDRVYYQETWEHEFEIDGEKHQFRVWDTPDERQFW